VRTLQPASRAQRTKRSRPSPSSAVRARRHTPPLGVAPICARSISDCHRRAPFTRGSRAEGLVIMFTVSFP